MRNKFDLQLKLVEKRMVAKSLPPVSLEAGAESEGEVTARSELNAHPT